MNAALQEAAQWFDRLHAHGCTPEQRAEFLEWLYEDPQHGEAFVAVERLRGRRSDAGSPKKTEYS